MTSLTEAWSDIPSDVPVARIALIGISGYAEIYLRLLLELKQLGSIRIVAAVVIDPESNAANIALLQKSGCTIYSDYKEMLRCEAGKIDLCLIPTGIPWHRRMSIAALEADMNVLVEKPLAGSVDDCVAIANAENRTGRFVAVGYQDLYTGGTRWLTRLLDEGKLGVLKSISVIGFWPRGSAYFERNAWAGRLHAQGAAVFDSPFNNAFGHFANLCLHFAGKHGPLGMADIKSVESQLFRARDIESFDTGIVKCRSSEGIEIWMGFSHSCRRHLDPVIQIEGSAGTATWAHQKGCSIHLENETLTHELPNMMGTRRLMLSSVIRRIKNQTERICGVTTAMPHAELIEAIHVNGIIRTVSNDLIVMTDLGDRIGLVPAITGIEDAMLRSQTTKSFLTEVDLEPRPRHEPDA